MNRILASLSALLLLIGCAKTANTPDTLPPKEANNPIERALHSTVLVQTLAGRTFCSASIIKNTGLLLSAWHCFEDGDDFRLVGFHGTYQADIIHKNAGQDLAVLRPRDVDIGRRDGIPLARKAPGFAATVFALGHARGDRFPFTLTRGIVAFPLRSTEGHIWMQSTAALNQGMSGGPTLNADGELVGINLFAYILPIARVYGHAHHSQITRAINDAR